MKRVEILIGRTPLGIRLMLRTPGPLFAEVSAAVEGIADGEVQSLAFETSPSRVWTFPFSAYPALLDLFDAEAWDTVPIPDLLLGLIRRKLGQPTGEDLPPGLGGLASWQSLYRYQQTGVKFILDRGGRGIIGDDMGLGKSIQALTLVQFYGVRTLIICPSSVKQHWVNEFSKQGLQLFNVQKREDPTAQFSVVSYSVISRRTSVRDNQRYKMLVLDEAHSIKSPKSKRTKLITQLAKWADHLLLLTGTPITRPLDLYPLFRILEPGVFTKFYPWTTRGRADATEFYYASRYCDPTTKQISRTNTCLEFNGARNLLELNWLLSQFMIRRLKTDVLQDLPPKERRVLEVEYLSEADNRFFRKELAGLTPLTEELGKFAANARLIELITCTARLKLEVIRRYLDQLLQAEDGDKFLLFAHHHLVLDEVSAVLEEKKVDFVRIDGRTPTKVRQDRVDRFQTQPEVRFALLGIQAAGTGLNLFSANRVVFLELIWSSKDMLQCEDRSHRIGQTRPVTVVYLVMKGSTDDVIIASLCRKFKISNLVTDNRLTSLVSNTRVSRQEMAELGVHP